VDFVISNKKNADLFNGIKFENTSLRKAPTDRKKIGNELKSSINFKILSQKLKNDHKLNTQR